MTNRYILPWSEAFCYLHDADSLNPGTWYIFLYEESLHMKYVSTWSMLQYEILPHMKSLHMKHAPFWEAISPWEVCLHMIHVSIWNMSPGEAVLHLSVYRCHWKSSVFPLRVLLYSRTSLDSKHLFFTPNTHNPTSFIKYITGKIVLRG